MRAPNQRSDPIFFNETYSYVRGIPNYFENESVRESEKNRNRESENERKRERERERMRHNKKRSVRKSSLLFQALCFFSHVRF